MATPLLDLLKRLADAKVEFVLVGGMAATVHGASIVTDDLDICVSFDLATCERILLALAGLDPYERMRPDRRPLSLDARAFVGFRHLYVSSNLGVLDLLGEITGVGGYDVLVKGALEVQLDGFAVRVMSLDDLLASKRAMARPKDLRMAIELELIRSRRGPQ